MNKFYSIVLLLFASLIMITICSCGTTDAKAAYKPPAEIFDVKISGTSEPQIDGVKFTYDSEARINTVSFTVDGYDYKQEYSYDSEKIVIKTIYKTEVVEEKVIRYVDIPVDNGFTTVDGYFVRLNSNNTSKTDDSNNDAEESNGSLNKTKEDSLNEVLKTGYWVRYSPQFSGFDAFSFSENGVSRKQYSFENGTVTPNGNDHKDSYSVHDNTVTISDTYGSSDWQYANGEMVYSWSDTLPDGNTFYYEQIIFHHDNIPDYETAVSEKSQSYK